MHCWWKVLTQQSRTSSKPQGSSNVLQPQDYPKLIVEVFRPIKTE
jgi:hypothetical protein